MCEFLDKIENRGVEKGFAQGLEQGKAEGIKQGKAEGIEQGIAEEQRRIAMLMLRSGESSEKILEFTGVNIKEIN